MSLAETLLLVDLSILLLMILFQTVSFKIVRSEKATVIIEFFPLRLVLYNFGKNKRKIRFKKRLKRFNFFLVPSVKSINFLLKRTKILLYELPSFKQKGTEPHRFFMLQTTEILIKSLLFCALNHQFKRTEMLENCFSSADDSSQSSTDFNLELSTKLYNLLLATLVFIFFSIKKKGRSKKVVRE